MTTIMTMPSTVQMNYQRATTSSSSLELLAQQALGIVCDVAARDVAVQNYDLRQQIAALTKFQETLTRLDIQWASSSASLRSSDQVNLLSYNNLNKRIGNEEYLSYDLHVQNIQIPCRNLQSMRFDVSGVRLNTGTGTEWLYKDHQVHVAKNKDPTSSTVLSVRLVYSPAICLQGRLKLSPGQDGEEVQAWLDCDRVGFFMALLGRRNTRTGRFVPLAEEPMLEGAMFHLDTIHVARHILHAALSSVVLQSPSSPCTTTTNNNNMSRNLWNEADDSNNNDSDDDGHADEKAKDDGLQDFHNLAQAAQTQTLTQPQHLLVTTIDDHQRLKNQHQSLVSLHSIFRTVSITTSSSRFGGEYFWELDLTKGDIHRPSLPLPPSRDNNNNNTTVEQLPAAYWQWEFPNDDAMIMTIPLSCLSSIRIALAHIPISHPMGPFYNGMPRVMMNHHLVVNFGGGVEAVFVVAAVDNNPEDDDDGEQQVDLLASINLAVLAASAPTGNATSSATTRSIVTADGQVVAVSIPEITLRLVSLRIRLDVVQEQLDLLGMDY